MNEVNIEKVNDALMLQNGTHAGAWSLPKVEISSGSVMHGQFDVMFIVASPATKRHGFLPMQYCLYDVMIRLVGH